VTDLNSFTADHSWIARFGELMILQMPEAMVDPPPMNDGHFAYLMQFTDGNRIDLTLFPLAKMHQFESESLSTMLLDKDGLFKELPPPSESDYLPKPPSAKTFADCCNEFWWGSTYVAKDFELFWLYESGTAGSRMGHLHRSPDKAEPHPVPVKSIPSDFPV
jgi:aminoglycoside 6-adenylyltransferase